MRRVLVALLLALTSHGAAPPAPHRLTAEDRKFLDSLFAFLVDPNGAERVSVSVKDLTWGHGDKEMRVWRVGGKGMTRCLGADGHVLITRGKAKPIDFPKECREWLIGEDNHPPLERVAWLHRLGHEGLAARLLARIPDRDEALKRLRADLAWAAYGSMVHAYMDRADAEALAHGERLLRLYPEEAREFEQGPALVGDLERRRKAGAFGLKKPAQPAGSDRWPVKRRVAYLIDALDDADPGQLSIPGRPWFSDDARVAALAEVGEAAVPALIDCLEKDTRLTRAVGYSRPWFRHREILPVREAALKALLLIIRVREFLGHPQAKDDGKEAAATLRAYWKQYGGMPLHRRLMAHLTDRRAKPEAWREAAYLLGRLGSEEERAWFSWSGGMRGLLPKRPNPALDLDRPTAAEAMLEALDRDLAADAAGERRRSPSDIRGEYLSPIAELRDPRIIPAMHRRLRGADAVERRALADACRRLGSSGPIDSYAEAFEKGKLDLPAGAAGEDEVDVAMRAMVAARRPACDRALFAMSGAGHWARAIALANVMGESGLGSRYGGEHWLTHPFCIALLAGELDNDGLTGAEVSVEGKSLSRTTGNSRAMRPVWGALADPAKRHASADERHQDRAGQKLTDVLVGVPMCHALFKDEAKRLAALKAYVAKYRGRFRVAAAAEAEAFELAVWTGAFIPDIRALGRAAKEADVKAGRAVFHLSGKGKAEKLPAARAVEVKGERGLVVQAESDGEGKVHYGVIFRHSMRRVDAADAKKPREERVD
jgi:HEAT repeat protein